MANSFFESILASVRYGVIVVDRELRVQAWNARAEDQWGLRAGEVQGRILLNLDFGLPVDSLGGPIRAVLADGNEEETVSLRAVNRRGQPVDCTVACLPLREDGSVTGVLVLVEAVPTRE